MNSFCISKAKQPIHALFLLINGCLNEDKDQILPPVIDHLGQRDLQIMPLKPGWRK
jgi:hypothetical protein